MDGSGSVSDADDGGCSEYDSTDFKIVAAIRATIGTFSALCCLVVILVIVVYKKYSFFAQRLILYLAISAFLHSLSYPLARVNYYSTRPILEDYCYFGGFFNNYTSWLEVLSICCLTFNVFMNVVLNKWSEKPEYVYLAIIWLLPLLWVWIPFLDHAYGNAGPWCGIRTVNEDCGHYLAGSILHFVLWYVPFYILLIVTFITTVIIALKIRNMHEWEWRYNPDLRRKQNRLQTEVKPLLLYLAIYLALNTFSFIQHTYDTAKPNDPMIALWYLHILTSPFRGAFIALVFALDSETRNRIKCSHLKAAFKSYFKDDAKEYDAHYLNFGDSLIT